MYPAGRTSGSRSYRDRATMNVERVLLAEPRGFCAGVEMAIKALAWMVRAFDPPVYCYHEIVHNKTVVERFERQGVVFVDDIGEVPPGRPDHALRPRLGTRGASRRHVPAAASSSIRSARWSRRSTTRSRSAPARATASSTSVTRATRRRSARWRWHRPRSAGSRRSPRSTPSPSSSNRWRCWPRRRCRTATGRASPLRVRERFPDVWTPGRSDLCFATTNRQSSLLAMVARCDAVVIIGSSNSSNTRAFEKLAREAGCERVHRVNTADELPDDLRHGRRDGRRLGARGTRRRVLTRLSPREGVEVVAVTDEDEYFPPPRNIRDLQAAIEVAATSMVGGALLTGRRWTTAACRPATFWQRSEVVH